MTYTLIVNAEHGTDRVDFDSYEEMLDKIITEKYSLGNITVRNPVSIISDEVLRKSIKDRRAFLSCEDMDEAIFDTAKSQVAAAKLEFLETMRPIIESGKMTQKQALETMVFLLRSD